MRNIQDVSPLMSIPENWSGLLQEWFRCLLLGEPKLRPQVSEQKWESWLKFIEWHGISSVAFSLIQPLGTELQPPADIYAALKRTHFANTARIVVRRTQLEHLIRRFEAAGIQTLVLKGAALGEMLYEDVFQRPSADIDLLVSKQIYKKARKVMLDSGYRSKRGDKNLEMDWTCEEEFVSPDISQRQQYVVELHWALAPYPLLLKTINIHTLFSRSETIVGPNVAIDVLNPVDALIYACMHLFYIHINELRLIWLYDIHLLAKRIDSLNLWQETVILSQEWQARLAVKNCLEIASQWFATPASELVSDLDYCPANQEEIQLFNYVEQQVHRDYRLRWLRKHIFQIQQLNGINKLRYIKSRMFPKRQEIDSGYPILQSLPWPLAYIGRLILMIASKR